MKTTLMIAAIALALAGCGGGGEPVQPAENNGTGGTGGGGPTGPASTSNTITVSDNKFDPPNTTVPPGTTVIWTWVGGSDGYTTPASHNVTWSSGFPGSATQETGTYQRVFSTAGTYTYLDSAVSTSDLEAALADGESRRDPGGSR